jgi:hypothetical protein
VARRIQNLSRGGGKAYKQEIRGIKELERKFKALKLDHPEITKEIYQVVGRVSDDVRNQMVAAARAAGWGGQSITTQKSGKITGDDAINAIFSYAKPRGGDSRKRISGLAGVGKRRTMAEWKAGRWPKSSRAKRKAGELVAESFATMLEIGTSNRPARPAIRTVIRNARQGVINGIAEGFRHIFAKYSK